MLLSKRVIYFGLVLFIIALMSVIACGEETTPPVTTTTPAPTTPAPTTPAPTQKYGGTLIYAYNQEQAQIGDPPTLQILRQAMIYDICLENLVLLNRAGEVIPWLATGWDIDPDAPSLTLTLRKGIKFHDGTVFDATAVKWNLDKSIQFKQPRLAAVDSVEVLEDYTVRLNLSFMDTMLLSYLAIQPGMMMSPTAYEKAGSTDEERSRWAKANPVGTGPFKFVSWEKDVKKVFEKNPDYWQEGKPYLDRVEFTVITNEATLLAAFKAGEVDVIYTEKPENLRQLEDTGKYTMLEGDIGLVGGLEPASLNEDEPWANILVRQAAAHAVDSEALCEAIGLGYYMPTNQYDAPGRWGYSPNVKGYPYNLAKAKELLAKAGYPDGFDTMINGMAPFEPLVTAFQGYLAEVGIRAKANLLPPPAMIELYGKGWTGVNMWQATCQPGALARMNGDFTAAATPARAHSLWVPSEWQDLLAEAVAATDFEKQKALTWQLQEDFVDKYCILNFHFAQKVPTPLPKYVHDLNTGVALHWTPYNTWIDK